MLIKPVVRAPGQYDADLVSTESGLACLDESKAKQAFAEECDINTIVRRFGLMGQLPENVPVILEGDFSETVTDFHSAMNLVVEAQRTFMLMPADVRSRFGNDPGSFVSFCSALDDKGQLANLDEMRKLGLAVPAAPAPKAPEPTRVVVVSTEPVKP